MTKRGLIFYIMMLLAILCMAEPFPLRLNNRLVWDGSLIPCSDDSRIVYWVDTSLGSAQIFAQKISTLGSLMWDDNLLVCESPEPKSLLGVLPSSDGCQIAVWQQKTIDSGYAICHMKIDSQGNRLWEFPGQAVSGMNTWMNARIVPNPVGGFYLIYRGFTNENVILMNSFGADGNSLWGEPRTLLSHSDRIDLESACADGSGGFIANLRKRSSPSTWQSHLIRINPAGEIQGPNPLLPQSPFSGTDFNLLASPQGNFLLYRLIDSGNSTLQLQNIDQQGNLQGQAQTFPIASGFYITGCELEHFEDGRLLAVFEAQQGVADDFRLKFQIFNPDLSPVWQGGCLQTLNSHPDSAELRAEISPEGAYWFFWQSRLAGFSPGGQSILPYEGLLITAEQAETPVLSCQGGNCLLVWAEATSTHNLQRQMLNSTGSILLPSGGMPIATCLESNAVNAKVFALGNRWLSLWKDERVVFNAGQIYYQILHGETALLEPQGRALNPSSVNPDYYHDAKVLPDNRLAILYGNWQGDQYSVWLQIIDQNGNRAYPGMGARVSLEQETSTVNNFHLGYDGADFYVGWSRMRTGIGKYIVAQRVSDGAAQWGTSGLIVQTYPMNSTSWFTAVHDNCLIWIYHPYGESNSQILALKLDQAGFPQTGWPAAGLCVVSAPGMDAFISSGKLESNLIFVYHDLQNPNGTERVQLLDPNGSLLWPAEGISLFPNQNNCAIRDLVYDDKCSMIYTWSSSPGLRFMRINQAGGLEADTADNVINPVNFTDVGLSLIRYVHGDYSCFFPYTDPIQPAWNGKDIYCQQINSEGRPWGFHTICSAFEDQSLPWAAAHGDFSMVVWKDLRTKLPGHSLDYPSVYASVFQSNSLGVEEDLPHPTQIRIVNYPNPFSTSTTIEYNLGRQSRITIRIYNLRGQLVRKLSNQSQTAGIHRLDWDGCDQSGRALSNGIYYCRLSDGAQTTVTKMLLLK